MSQDFHNRIATISINQFNRLPKTGKPNLRNNEWTVLSCIIKENKKTDNFEVIALGTGSKCIGKTKLSPKGDILNDSHAEIICRRAFLRYIYEQINFKNIELFHFNNTKCSVNNWIEFHFFTSHMPCGDAAIFSKQNPTEFGNVLMKRSSENDIPHAIKKAKLDTDIYRTGAKCLPHSSERDLQLHGPKYHTLGAVRTKPGRGDPTLSVSCSDKLAKWCHVGVQGALLSLILAEPIYCASLTIAGQTPYNEQSLRRALYKRFDQINLQLPYQPKKMSIGQATINFQFCKEDGKVPCPTSIIWFKSSARSHEVAVEGIRQGITKKNQTTKAVRLQICKIELFGIFLKTASSLKLSLFNNLESSQIFYNEAKAKASDYQYVWEYFKREGFKSWTLKDEQLQQFTIN